MGPCLRESHLALDRRIVDSSLIITEEKTGMGTGNG